jgi:integrase
MTDDILKDYFQNIQVAPSTEKLYRYHFKNYEKATEYTLKELLEEAEDEESRDIKPRNRKIKQHIQQYKEYLNEKGYSPGHIKIALTVIRTFYRDMEIEIPYTRRQRTRQDDPGTKGDLPGKEDISNALEYATPKYRAIILLMASSGMGRGEVLSLTVQDFLDSIQKYNRNPVKLPLDIGEMIKKVIGRRGGVARWKVTRQKTGFKYFTFSSPESIVAILKYLERYPPQSLDEHIFRGHYNKPMNQDSLNVYFNHLNKKLGFGKSGRLAYFRSHNLRKYFTNMMFKAGLPQLSIDFMLGHRLNDKVTEAYFKPDPETLEQYYLKALPYLTIHEKVEVRVVTDERLQELEEGRKQDQKRIDELEKIIKRRYQIEQVPPTND